MARDSAAPTPSQGKVATDLRLVAHLVPAWPKLAWLARVRRGTSDVDVWHGPSVEVSNQWIVEAVWSDDFDSGDIDQTDLIFGTGMRLRGSKVIFVSAGTTVDRLCWVQKDDSWYIANSLPALLAVAGVDLRDEYSEYKSDICTLASGIDRYKRAIPSTGNDVELVYFHNLTWDGNRLFETPKPDVAPGFRRYEDYHAFLIETAERLAANASHRDRGQIIKTVSTISSGYDAAAATVIARQMGCSSTLTIKQSASLWRGSDSGHHIAEQLGLDCKAYDRTARRYPLEEAVWAVSGHPTVLNWTLFDYPKPLCLLVTGCYGDQMWTRRRRNLSCPFMDSRVCDGGLGEFRLIQGVLHCPVPFWGVQHRRELHEITFSAEMEPWALHNKYDRPIPRRILEDAGISREAFGQRKMMVANDEPFLWPYSANAQKSFRSFLQRRNVDSPGPFLVWFYRRLAWADFMVNQNVTRRLGLPDFGLRRRLATAARNLLFQWANAELKRRYEATFREVETL
jgi:hypothetical protein